MFQTMFFFAKETGSPAMETIVRLGRITRLLWYWYTAFGMLDVPQCCGTGAGIWELKRKQQVSVPLSYSITQVTDDGRDIGLVT